MSAQVEFCVNRASGPEIADHLSRCDDDFVPPLSGRVEIGAYAHKIAGKAMRFEAWADGALVGLVAAYCNDSERRAAYITSVSVLRNRQGNRIAARLLALCAGHAKEQGFGRIELEVDRRNLAAVALYKKSGFMVNTVSGSTATMHLKIGKDT